MVLWDEIMSMKLNHFRDIMRWDIFEENFISYLLDKMNFNNDILNKINWKDFLTNLMENCAVTIAENNEMPQPASNPKLMGYYKGLFVKKEKFTDFAGEDLIFKALQRAMNIGTDGLKIQD